MKKLIAKENRIYDEDGKYICSISYTDRFEELLDESDREESESWLSYRQRTKPERELEKQKQFALAKKMAESFNAIHT